LSPTQIDTIMATAKKPGASKIIINLRSPDDPFSYKGVPTNNNQSNFGE